MSKSSILYFIADSDLAGAPRQVFYLVRGMAHSYEVSIICPSGWLAQQAKALGITVYAYKPNLGRKGLFNFVQAVMQKVKPTILHCHGVRAGVIGPFAARHATARVVYTEHLLTKDFHLPSKLRQFIQLVALRRSLRLVDKVVAVSEAVASYMRNAHLANKTQLSVIYGGIEPITKGQDVSKPVIGTLGTLTWVKGVDTLLEAVRLIKKDIPVVHCRIGGDGPMLTSLQATAKDLGVSENIEWCGTVPDAAAFYHSLQVYAQPSRSESFGMAALEAMSAGMPVVAAKTGALPEIIADEESGFLYKREDPKDLALKLLRVLSAPSIRAKVAEGAMKQARHFAIDTMITNYQKLYESMV